MHKVSTVFRYAAPDDSSCIAKLYGELVSNPNMLVTRERIAEVAQDRNTALLVCEFQDLVVGTALVSFCNDVMFNAQPFAVVENVIIEASMRGQGIGHALFQYIERICANRGCSKIMLLSSAARSDAHRFFEHAGYLGSTKRAFVKYSRQFMEKA